MASSTLALVALASAMPSTSGGRWLWMLSRMPGLLLRMVPVMLTVSGMMLPALPPWMVPTLTTPMPSRRSTRRLTSVCRPLTICALATIGSAPVQGIEPWVCLPVTVTRKPSALLSAAPDL
ncbi:hypothetical protein D3C78_1293320 [compost metagenome]